VWGNASPVRGLFVDGDIDGFGNPRVELTGSGSTLVLNAALTGNSAVVLPPGSVSADEMLNEPGLSQGRLPSVTASVTSTSTMETVVSTTITTPASGYIVVDAVAQHGLTTAGPDNLISIQVDEMPGGVPDPAYYVLSGYSGGAPAGSQFFGVHARRTYFKGAGTWTFLLEARKESAGGTSWLYNPTITATYLPTSYGSVTTATTGVERVDFDHATAISPADRGSFAQTAAGPASAPAWLVDLRELESRAARERERLERTERALAEARLKARAEASASRGSTRGREDRREPGR
jgi:hypothetical protein